MKDSGVRAEVREILKDVVGTLDDTGKVIYLHHTPPPRRIRLLLRIGSIALLATTLLLSAALLPLAQNQQSELPGQQFQLATNDCTDYRNTPPAKVSQNPDPYFRAMEMLGIQNPCNQSTDQLLTPAVL